MEQKHLLTATQEVVKFAKQEELLSLLAQAEAREKRQLRAMTDTEKVIAELEKVVAAVNPAQIDVEEKTGSPSRARK